MTKHKSITQVQPLRRPTRRRPSQRQEPARRLLSDTGYRQKWSGGRIEIEPVYPEPAWSNAKLIVRKRAKRVCELCGLREGEWYESRDVDQDDNPVWKKQGRLQIMHLDHDSQNCNPDHLKAGCNRCHGTHDKRHHNGHGMVTGAIRGTLKHERAWHVLTRIFREVAETRHLEPGEAEALLAWIVSLRGNVNLGIAARVINTMVKGVLDHEVLQEQLRLVARRLVLREFASLEDGKLTYRLSRPMWQEEEGRDVE